MPGLGYGKPKPGCVRNKWAYQVFLLTMTLLPESQVLQATSTPCCPQEPCRSSHSSSSKNLARVASQHEPCKLMLSTRSPFCLRLYSFQYWKWSELSKR